MNGNRNTSIIHWIHKGLRKTTYVPEILIASDLTANIRRKTVFRRRLAGHGPHHQSATICKCERQQSKPGLKSSRNSRNRHDTYWLLHIIVKECNENMQVYSENMLFLLPPLLITRPSMWHILINHQSLYILGRVITDLKFHYKRTAVYFHDIQFSFSSFAYLKYILFFLYAVTETFYRENNVIQLRLAHSTYTVPLFSRT